LGFELYSAVIAQGKNDGVRRIEWNVLDWNTPAIEFYEKSGAKVLKDWLVAQMDENGIAIFLEKNKK
jgi:RimJ/RimL family protein N-acetyltransferase